MFVKMNTIAVIDVHYKLWEPCSQSFASYNLCASSGETNKNKDTLINPPGRSWCKTQPETNIRVLSTKTIVKHILLAIMEHTTYLFMV